MCYWEKSCLPQVSMKFLQAEELTVMRIPYNCMISKQIAMQYYFSKPQGRWLQCQFCCYSDYPRRIKLTVAYKSNLFWKKYFCITYWISQWADILLQPQHNKITWYTLPFKRKHTFPTPQLLLQCFCWILMVRKVSEIKNRRLSKASERDKQDTCIPVPLLFLTTHKGENMLQVY